MGARTAVRPAKRSLWRRLAAVAGVSAFTVMSMVIPSGTGPVSSVIGSAPAHADSGSTSKTEVVTDPQTHKSYNLSMTISQTQNLQPRQHVVLSWSGFEPTHNYNVMSTANLGREAEYPVVLLQCWGTDTAAAPLDPTHCFSGSPNIRRAVYDDTNDPGAPNPTPAFIHPIRTLGDYLGFTDVSGKKWKMINNNNTPVDLQTTTLQPANSQFAYTTANGSRNDVPFDLRSADEYPSLGCSAKAQRQCSLVAVPILHPSCVSGADRDCTGPAYNPVGPGIDGTWGNPYLGGQNWWLTSEWRNRISFPLSFAPQPGDCPLTDSRPPLGILGSELAYPAMYSWVPNFCFDPRKANIQYIPISEPGARDSLVKYPSLGYANAVLTSQPVTGSPRPVVHAPVAVTGFAVTFLIDDANHQQVASMNLTPLLLAKLVTDAYTGNWISEPALSGNPPSLFKDKEFQAANPGFSVASEQVPSNMNMVMLGGGNQSDVIWALTSYINADPEARAWLDGQPDAYSGMVVNPAYRGYSLPQLATELRDQYQETAIGDAGIAPCQRVVPTPDQLLFSQPVNSLQDAAFAQLDRRSPAAWRCDALQTNRYKKLDPQTVGTRELIALTSVPFAAEYGLPMANLQVHHLASGSRLYAAANATSMAAALAFATQDKATGVLSLDYPHLSPAAYPGTMPVYAAVPTSSLDSTAAKGYAQFLTFAASNGQVVGSDVGQLPQGYAPLSGALAPLAQYTLAAADHVAAQDGQVPAPPPNVGQEIAANAGVSAPFNEAAFAGSSGSGADGVGTAGAAGGGVPGGGAAPSGGSGPSSASATSPVATSAPRPHTTGLTRGGTSWLARWTVLGLLGIGLLAGILVPLVRLAATPGHPVRAVLAGLRTRLVALRPHRTR